MDGMSRLYRAIYGIVLQGCELQQKEFLYLSIIMLSDFALWIAKAELQTMTKRSTYFKFFCKHLDLYDFILSCENMHAFLSSIQSLRIDNACSGAIRGVFVAPLAYSYCCLL